VSSKLLVIVARCSKESKGLGLDGLQESEFNYNGSFRGKAITKIKLKHRRHISKDREYVLQVTDSNVDDNGCLRGIVDKQTILKDAKPQPVGRASPNYGKRRRTRGI